MSIPAKISYNVKWPKKLVDRAKKGGTFSRGIPWIDKRVLKRVGNLMVKEVRDNIRLSRSITGGNLKALSQKRKDRKSSQGMPYPNTPLRAWGTLYRSIYYSKTKSSEDNVVVAIKKVGKYGTKTIINAQELAATQQSGSYGGPPRLFFGISNKSKKLIKNLIKREFLVKFRRAELVRQSPRQR